MSTALAKIARRVIDEPIEERIGRYVLRHERNIARLEKLLKTAEGRTALLTIIAMERLENEFLKMQMEMGIISRAAQLSTIVTYEFSSSMGCMPPTGRTVSMFDAPGKTIAGELTDGT